MKNREELEKMAREIVEWIRIPLRDPSDMVAKIAEALQKVQDEAMGARLPSKDEDTRRQDREAKELHQKMTEGFIGFVRTMGENINQARKQRSEGTKPAPKEPLSEEDVSKFAQRIVEEKDWIHNENRRALGEAVMVGARWAERRLLGDE